MSWLTSVTGLFPNAYHVARREYIVRVRNRTRHPRIRERRHSGEQHNGHGGGTERSERSHHDD